MDTKNVSNYLIIHTLRQMELTIRSNLKKKEKFERLKLLRNRLRFLKAGNATI